MATIRPIPFQELRSQDLTWHLDDDVISSSSSISDSDSDVSSSEASSSASSASSSDSSDQESDSDADSDSDSDSSQEEDTSGHSDVDIRPASSIYPLDSLGSNFLDTLGDMTRTDNLGYIAWLVPFTGICTMLSTELLACVNHFSCSENFPTLSYAATFRPEGHAFTGGMCLTAMFILASVVLFCWYLHLRRPQVASDTMVAGYMSLMAGVIAAISLFGLAVMDMRSHHDAHINFTIAFFIAAWVTMIAVQRARKSILHEHETADDDGKMSAGASLLLVVRQRSFWRSLRRWRRLDFMTAYNLGRLLLNIGLASTFLFGLFFLCANGVWPNPLGFTAVQEAFFEALAIVCQLFFMGTLSCELARLARLVEHSDYAELEKE